ncbi:nicotinate phosphoribosyltransferase [Flammula alnicola]|nr:nicotinate phosphoribosyltransferase [Flammula alnicola]
MSAPLSDLAVPPSILDTDLYKLTMQQAVLRIFPDIQASYRFTNRSASVLFSRQCIERFRTAVSHFSTVSLSEAELQWLKKACPYLSQDYLSYLSSYRYKPEQVKVKYIPVTSDNLQGKVEIDIVGPWVETILWEVPLMACLSESYFQTVAVDWNYDHQDEIAYSKGKTLLEAGCHFSEFGTRRRRSFRAQDIVVQALVRASHDIGTGGLSGTSNVHLAQKYDLTPIGTIAHEWFMGVAALRGYEKANTVALKLWEEAYDGKEAPSLHSGDPFIFAPRVKTMYQSLGIPHDSKSLIFSDALNVEKCLEIKKQCDELGFSKVSFGIGTNLTNDFRTASTGEKSKALNIVIKLASVDKNPASN